MARAAREAGNPEAEALASRLIRERGNDMRANGRAADELRQAAGGDADEYVALGHAETCDAARALFEVVFDAFTRASLQEHLLDLWEAFRPTLVLVTHDVEEAAFLADRVLVMRPRPGRFIAEFELGITRPRDRYGSAVESAKRKILRALDLSLRGQREGEELAPAAAI